MDDEVRQVFDLPEVRAVVTEQRVEKRRCACGVVTTGVFPREAIGPTCYGPGVRALLTYLIVAQHLPIERATQVFEECCGIAVSTGFASSLLAEAGPGLNEFVQVARAQLRQSPTLHLDETGVLPGYQGVAIHDGWTPYRAYENVTHALCNAHHLRELQAVFEEGQSWADETSELLCATHQEVRFAKEAQIPSLSPRRLISITRRYDQLIEAGHAANPPPIRTGKRGRPLRTKAANLVGRLDRYRCEVLRFANDFSVSFDNNQAERDLRMVKLQQKISRCYRTEAGATNYPAVRSYISTARKQRVNVLDALRDRFEGKPFLPRVAQA